MTEKTLNQDRLKADNARHWTEQAQQPASEPMAWRDCLRAKRPKAQNLEAGTRTEEARAWTESPEPASTTKGKASGRQTAWILAALLIGLPLVLLVFGHWLAWIAVAALAPQIIVFCVRSLAYTQGSGSSCGETDDNFYGLDDYDDLTPVGRDLDGDLVNQHMQKFK
ncbi:MAG: hypothetical protein COB00_21055 [Alcanivorax sp.]|mgnify:CR=1 FL=1|nr:MAG: hypothetical protein COB00_21055 [Alcanivorax sp.]|tara:strand:+ start:3855 stop:4355 length:501 start_codon:yes stop_codon:yes gene_type:complete